MRPLCDPYVTPHVCVDPQVHPQEAQRGHPGLRQRRGLQAGALPGGEHGADALGAAGLSAAPGTLPGPTTGAPPPPGDDPGGADAAGGLAARPGQGARSLPPLAR